MVSASMTGVASTEAAGTDTGQSRSGELPVSRSRAEIILWVQAREQAWLDDVRQGHSIKQIAAREGLSCRRIQHGVNCARVRGDRSRIRDSRSNKQLQTRNDKGIANAGRAAGDDLNRPPPLVPLFPIGPFTPRSACPHHGPIRAGSVICCMVCSRSGIDDHPGLKRDPRTDPRPEPKAAAPARVASVHETRRQRRQRLHAARRARLGTVASLAKDAHGPTSQSSIPSP